MTINENNFAALGAMQTHALAQALISGDLISEQNLAQESPRPADTSSAAQKIDGQALGKAQLEKVAQQLQEFVSQMSKSVQFQVDQESGRDVIKVIDKNSGDVLKQYPSEEVLALVARLNESTGNFINDHI